MGDGGVTEEFSMFVLYSGHLKTKVNKPVRNAERMLASSISYSFDHYLARLGV